jgi:Domain of unknown function (DU1801)
MATYDAKTKMTSADVTAFLAAVEPENRAVEARQLIDLFREATTYEPRLWGGGIVGFGRYAYRYESGHSGESLAVGFSPRKADLSIYIPAGFAERDALLMQLGKHKVGKACLYLKRLSDADPAVLQQLIRAGLADLATRWTVLPE